MGFHAVSAQRDILEALFVRFRAERSHYGKNALVANPIVCQYHFLEALAGPLIKCTGQGKRALVTNHIVSKV